MCRDQHYNSMYVWFGFFEIVFTFVFFHLWRLFREAFCSAIDIMIGGAAAAVCSEDLLPSRNDSHSYITNIIAPQFLSIGILEEEGPFGVFKILDI